jgi:hypothetical protein
MHVPIHKVDIFVFRLGHVCIHTGQYSRKCSEPWWCVLRCVDIVCYAVKAQSIHKQLRQLLNSKEIRTACSLVSFQPIQRLRINALTTTNHRDPHNLAKSICIRTTDNDT